MLNNFRRLYLDIPDSELTAAAEVFRQYALLAAEIAGIVFTSALTTGESDGTVVSGHVGPIKTQTKA